jgi:hypothetical protein
VAAAIFGLIGVLVGGVLNFVTTMYVQGRQERSSLQAIARLAYDDCLHFQSTLVRTLATGKWWQKGEVIKFQVGRGDRKQLLGELPDEASQDVADAIGWARYTMLRREHSDAEHPTPTELQMLRDTFCRLDAARWQLSGKPSGRTFRSFRDGAVLATLDTPTTLEDLGIGDERCEERRRMNYGREATP